MNTQQFDDWEFGWAYRDTIRARGTGSIDTLGRQIYPKIRKRPPPVPGGHNPKSNIAFGRIVEEEQ